MNEYVPNNIVISVKNLTKLYHLYDKPQDRLKEALHPLRKSYHHDFYALKGVSFEIKKGETVGIIGKNGAGKSTLLKMITGVLTPTEGEVTVKGKISSLLELGAGFNSEISGLENIYLNGTLMGLSKEEVDAKIDDILAFADIGEFIHQNVKMYSSGMFARLAFSVAINVEPDVLIIDEALSVGDIAFQYKCFEKMKEIKQRGTTIVFVTHSMGQILDNCERVIFLNNSQLVEDSYDAQFVVTEYEKAIRNIPVPTKVKKASIDELELDTEHFDLSVNTQINEKRFGTHRAIFQKIIFTDTKDAVVDALSFTSGTEVFIKFYVLSKESIDDVVIGVSIKGADTSDIWGDNNLNASQQINLKKGLNKITYSFNLSITGGEYLLFCGMATFSGGNREELDQRWPVKKFQIFSEKSLLGYVYSPIKIDIQES